MESLGKGGCHHRFGNEYSLFVILSSFPYIHEYFFQFYLCIILVAIWTLTLLPDEVTAVVESELSPKVVWTLLITFSILICASLLTSVQLLKATQWVIFIYYKYTLLCPYLNQWNNTNRGANWRMPISAVSTGWMSASFSLLWVPYMAAIKAMLKVVSALAFL